MANEPRPSEASERATRTHLRVTNYSGVAGHAGLTYVRGVGRRASALSRAATVAREVPPVEKAASRAVAGPRGFHPACDLASYTRTCRLSRRFFPSDTATGGTTKRMK